MNQPDQTGIETAVAQRDVAAFRAGLPQGGHLSDEAIVAWMEHAEASDDFHDASWHYNRLKGIGGSEAIYAAQQALIDEGKAPTSPGELPGYLASEKLLQRAPEPPDLNMLRGNRFEALIIERFLDEHEATRRDDLMERVAAMSGRVANHPWLIGNPDLIAELRDGRIALVDTKAPGQATATVDPAYEAQLHHYRRLMLEAGVPPDVMLIGNFDWQRNSVLALPVDFDRHLDRRLRDGGDLLWAAILAGEVPDHSRIDWPRPSWQAFGEDEREQLGREITQGEERYLLKRIAADRLAQKVKAEGEALTTALRRLGPMRGNKPADYGFTLTGLRTQVKVDEERFQAVLRRKEKSRHIDDAYDATKRYDADAMARRLAELGEDPERYRERKLNTTKAIDVLERNGIPYEHAIGDILEEAPSLSLSVPARGERLETYNAISEFVETHADHLVTTLDSMVGPQQGDADDSAVRGDGNDAEARPAPPADENIEAVLATVLSRQAEYAEALWNGYTTAVSNGCGAWHRHVAPVVETAGQHAAHARKALSRVGVDSPAQARLSEGVCRLAMEVSEQADYMDQLARAGDTATEELVKRSITQARRARALLPEGTPANVHKGEPNASIFMSAFEMQLEQPRGVVDTTGADDDIDPLATPAATAMNGHTEASASNDDVPQESVGKDEAPTLATLFGPGP